MWLLTDKLVYKLSNVSDDLKWATNTYMTQFTLTFKEQLTISMVLEDFLFLNFVTHPPIFLPIHIRFYPSKWRVDGSLHKAMLCSFCLHCDGVKTLKCVSPPGQRQGREVSQAPGGRHAAHITRQWDRARCPPRPTTARHEGRWRHSHCQWYTCLIYHLWANKSPGTEYMEHSGFLSYILFGFINSVK